MRLNRLYRHTQWVPTNEDLLDVNFQAIVSDLRSIVRGTLTPRPWSDISSAWTWDDVTVTLPKVIKNTEVDRKVKLRGEGITHYQEYCRKLREEARAARELRDIAKKVKREERLVRENAKSDFTFQEGVQFRTMTRIFMANGMTHEDAQVKARKLVEEMR